MFKVIKDFPNYAINEDGVVLRIKDSKTSKSGKKLKTTLGRYGYPSLILRHDKKAKRRTIHRLIMETFVGPRPPKMEINHIDGNRANSVLSNLEYCTSSENKYHANKIGLGTRGTKNGMAKLTNLDVITILNLRKDGLSQEKIAKIFNVNRTTVQMIEYGKNWFWIKEIVELI